MAIVEIKGIGKAQFPDGMSAESIRDFLRNKYYQQRNDSDILQPVDNIAAPYEPTLTEKIGQNVANALTGSGLVSDNYGAQQVGKNVTALGEFLPGIGDATAGDEFGRAVAKGDKFGMAMAGIGAIPIAGDLAKKTLKAKFPDFKIGISETPDNIVLDKIIVPDEARGSGQGTEFMVQLIADADKKGKSIGLTPSSDFGGNKKRLTEFYKRFGFVDNKGKNKDFTISESMIRTPREFPLGNKSLPMDEVKQVTSYNDMFDFTPEQMAQQLRSSKPENVVDGVYVEPTKFGEKRFNPDGSIEIVKDGSILRRIDPQDSDMAYKNKIMKNESEKPEVKAIQEKRKADFDAERARQQSAEKESYKMQHTAPTREDNPSGDDLTDTFGEDIYSGRALQYFGTGSSYDSKAINIIQGMRGKPEKVVTIYRAVPNNVKDINASDWVTTTKEYAQDHMEGEKGWHILSKKVKAKDIATDGNSIHEFGYDPANE